MASFTTVADVRAYLGGPTDAAQFTTAVIGSNIVVASGMLQRMTNRQFEAQAATTKRFSTEGRNRLTIPDLTTATSVTLNTAALTADSSYYLIPDVQNSGVFVAIDLPQYRYPRNYHSYPDWFDKNYDSPLYQQRLASGIPNDLVIVGTWGHATIPPEVAHATKVLAAWYTKRPDAVLSNVIVTPEGNILDLSRIPPEVAQFVNAWRIAADELVSV